VILQPGGCSKGKQRITIKECYTGIREGSFERGIIERPDSTTNSTEERFLEKVTHCQPRNSLPFM